MIQPRTGPNTSENEPFEVASCIAGSKNVHWIHVHEQTLYIHKVHKGACAVFAETVVSAAEQEHAESQDFFGGIAIRLLARKGRTERNLCPGVGGFFSKK